MTASWQRGNSNLTGILIIIFLLFVIITSPREEINNPNIVPGTTIGAQNTNGSNNRSSGTYPTPSAYAPGYSISSGGSRSQSIYLGSGNAPYSYQPYEEYITLENTGESAVNITGWQLKNGKDERPYLVGSSLQRFSADIAIIPQATKLLEPRGQSYLQDVILERNERAIITTGKLSGLAPYNIVSFKENMCTGYLEDLPDYAFNPSLERNCPRPALEPGIQNLHIECRKVVENLSPCETPVFGGKDREGQFCPECLEGQDLGSLCNAFIKEHFSYQGCLVYHKSDPDFSSRTWRVFLGRGWEMWAKEYESIELFDRFGQLVTFQNY